MKELHDGGRGKGNALATALGSFLIGPRRDSRVVQGNPSSRPVLYVFEALDHSWYV